MIHRLASNKFLVWGAVGVTARAVGDAMKYHNKPKYTRERLVFRYVNALERGDLETVGVILEQAEQDAELERMILEVNDFYVLEQLSSVC